MNKSLKQTSWLIIGTALAAFSYIGTATADDIEIFVAGEDPDLGGGVNPNIMFILDTSGSMGTIVQTQDVYDDDIIYTGACDSDYLYVTTNSTEPTCATATRKLKRSLSNCFRAENKFDSGQFYSDRLAMWKPDSNANSSKWVALPNGEITGTVDCRRDRVRDNNIADGKAKNDGLYARDGSNGPYDTSATKHNKNKNRASYNNTYYLWSGNLLNWGEATVIPQSRLATVQSVVVNLLDGLERVNVGLMRFNSSQGGPVLIDVEDIETNRGIMKAAVNALPANGWTPLSETFYEFGQYMYGKPVVYGDGFENRSVAASRTGNDINSTNYESPTEFLCQKNYVIYLTDGAPTQDTGAETAIEAMIGKQCANDHGSNNGKCLDELAEYYATTPVPVGGKPGQPIRTYTIGFNVNLPLLEETARKGNPSGVGELGYFTADDTSELSTTLTKIAVEILKDSTTFTAPAVPVNSFNRTENLNTVYTSLFQPSSSVHWPGNLKRYAFKGGEFIGVDDKPAINPTTGFFSETAWSFWTNTPDGSNITIGGAADEMPTFMARKLISDINGDTLMANANRIALGNVSLTAETFGASTGNVTINGMATDWVSAMINWLNGMDLKDANNNKVFTDTRRQYGDPLHARPVPIVYGGTVDAPDIVVYLTTNDGQLHAVDAETGQELWAYTPGSVLNRLHDIYIDEVTAIKRYILDGQPVVYVLNDDGKPGFTGAGERAIMIFGMRRGGSSYFALDITDKNNPKKLWEIDDNAAGDFPYMGQSWSEPQIGLVKVGSNDKGPVMFIGGGYDVSQDNNDFSTDSRGNAIYMIDLLTGNKLWSAGDNSTDHDLVMNMQHSIPAPPLVIDTNRDGLLDRLYVGDMGGRVWRMDFENGNSASTFGTGGMMATLGAADLGSPDAEDVRRFYSQVDLVEDVYGEIRYFAINLGSGYRAHPLDRATDEEFYSVRDFKPYAKLLPADAMYTNPVERDDLIDITNKPATPLKPTSPGWRLSMDLGDGEKVLGKSLTLNGIVYFTSFAPGGNADSCTADKGTNRLYAVSLGFGRPIVNLDVIAESETYETQDFATDLKFGGLGSEVFLMSEKETIYDKDGNAIGEETSVRPCSSLVCGTDKIVLNPTRTYWTQEGM